MKITYDSRHDVLRIRFTQAVTKESEEPSPGFIIDYSADGAVVGLEILDASKSLGDPRNIEFAETAA
jgi:uncharacterized protein YuzE